MKDKSKDEEKMKDKSKNLRKMMPKRKSHTTGKPQPPIKTAHQNRPIKTVGVRRCGASRIASPFGEIKELRARI